MLEAVEKTPNEHWRTHIQNLDYIWHSMHQKRETSKRFKWDTDITQAENVLVQNYHSRLRRNLEDNNLAEAEMISQQMWTHVERLRETQVHADDEEASASGMHEVQELWRLSGAYLEKAGPNRGSSKGKEAQAAAVAAVRASSSCQSASTVQDCGCIVPSSGI